MPGSGEKAFREEIAKALEINWMRERSKGEDDIYQHEDAFRVIQTGSIDSVINYCGDTFILTVRKV